MLGSMYSAVSGLQAHQTKLNVIGNNIANVNTNGFKSSRVTFSDVFYQTMSTGSSATGDFGGTNPIQLGSGAKINSIDVINTRAGSATTNRALDVYIKGEGYLPVKDNNGIVKYTRVGILNFDASGNLVDNKGNMVLGIPFDSKTGVNELGADGTVRTQDLVPINLTPKELDKYTGISIGWNGEVTGIRAGDPTIIRASNTQWLSNANLTKSSLYSGEITMTITRGDDVSFLAGTYNDGTAVNGIAIDTDADINGEVRIKRTGSDYTLSYTRKDGTIMEETATDTTGTVTFNVADINGGTVPVTVAVGADPTTEFELNDGEELRIGTVVADEMAIHASTYDRAGNTINLSGTWSSGDKEMTLGDMTLEVDPVRFGTLGSGEVVDRLVGKAGPGPGEAVKVANLSIAKFANADGLSQEGDSYYMETTNSGGAVLTLPGNEGTGTLLSGSLEMSNVDLSREFTEMIIAQRGFQANTRMITVSDEILTELVNMKR